MALVAWCAFVAVRLVPRGIGNGGILGAPEPVAYLRVESRGEWDHEPRCSPEGDQEARCFFNVKLMKGGMHHPPLCSASLESWG